MYEALIFDAYAVRISARKVAVLNKEFKVTASRFYSGSDAVPSMSFPALVQFCREGL